MIKDPEAPDGKETVGDSARQMLLDPVPSVCLGYLVPSFMHEVSQPLNTIGMAAYNLRQSLHASSNGSHTDDAAGLQRAERISEQVRAAKALLQKMATIGAALDGEADGKIAESLSSVLDVWDSGLRKRRIRIWLSGWEADESVLGEADGVAAAILIIASLQEAATRIPCSELRSISVSILERSGELRIEFLAENDSARDLLGHAKAIAENRTDAVLRRRHGQLLCRLNAWTLVLSRAT